MNADRLREAARVLRERAEGTTWSPECGGWWLPGMDTNAVAEADVGVATASSEGVARFIATMHPGVALALVDWLDACGDFMADHPAYRHDGEDYAARVADLILGAEDAAP